MTAQAVESEPSNWLSRNRWKIGITLATLVGGLLWQQRARRKRRIAVGPVSERWLAEQQFDAGQHPAE